MNNQTIEQLNNRNLDNCYFCIYSIPITIFLNDGGDDNNLVNPKKLMIFYGCNLQGKRRYITSVIADDFDKPSAWYDFFLSWKNKGLNTILFALLPLDNNIRKAIKIAFPYIEIFNSYCDSIMKISKYFTLKYSSNTFDIVRKIYVSKSLDDYNIAYNDFIGIFSNSKFLIDFLNDDFIKAKDNYRIDFSLRKHIFAFYFIRELSKKLIVISHSKPFFSSIDDFISNCIPIIQVTEKKNYCSKADWIILINSIYDDKKDLIKCYL